MIQNQKGRRNVSTFVMVELGLKLEDLFKQKGLENKSVAAKENIEKRQADELNNFVNQDKQNSAKPGLDSYLVRPQHEIEKTNTREEIANFANTSHDTVMKVKKIKEKAPDEVIQKVKSGEISINQAYTTIKKQENEEKQKEQHEQSNVEVEFPTGKFKCLVIDPPWDVKKILRDSRPKQAEFAYKTMSDEEISELLITSISHDDCHLYLWTTHKKLPTASANFSARFTVASPIS